MSRVCLQFVIVVFPDHTHFLFLSNERKSMLKCCWNEAKTILFCAILCRLKQLSKLFSWCLECNLGWNVVSAAVFSTAVALLLSIH